jgi:diguanylate cyclase (GGDEF)-like protein/PAS domain S-box-containing protein
VVSGRPLFYDRLGVDRRGHGERWGWATRGQIPLARDHAPHIDRRLAADHALREAPIAIYSVDLDGVVLSWNRSAEHLFGWTEADVVGELAPFLPLDKFEEVAHVRDRLVAGGGAESIEYCPVTPDGRVRHVVTSASLVRDDAGAPTSVIGFALDVTETQEAAAAIARAEAKWRTLLQSTSDTVTLLDADGRVRQTTGEFTDVLGYEFDWWPGRSGFDLIHPDDLPRAAGVFAELLDAPGETYAEVLRTRTASGHWELIEYTAVNRLDDPLVESIVITTRNVTEVTQAEVLLADEAKILELIARGAPLTQTLESIASMVDYHTSGDSGVFMLSDDGRHLIASAAPSLPPRLVEAAEAIIMEPGNEPLLWSNDPAECADFTEHRGRYDADFLVDVGYRAGWSVPVVDTRDEHVMGTIAVLHVVPRLPTMRERDVVGVATHLVSIAIERHLRQIDLEHQARHDHLTQLPNRRAILERVADAIDRTAGDGLAPAVLLLDLDRFKVVNDSLGHTAGDDLLVAFGERLRVVTGDTTFVGHFGGDEFVVVLDAVADVSDALAVARRIELALSEPFTVSPLPDTEYELHLSASMGIALATGDDCAHEVLQHADAAMHGAKVGGHDRVAIFDDELQARATELLHVDRELRMAVERAELTVHYQPKVDLVTGTVVGVEALLRWEHPEKGLVAPSAFIDVAEETGLIVRIGRWVLEEAVRQARVWTERLGLDSWIVAVNLSARQLTAADLVAHVASVLHRNDWPADHLVLELTESILIDDAEATLAVLQDLKQLGVKLAIDDFGTGYSSLSYLHRFPVDIVKIDRAFVEPLRADGEGSPVATAVLHMARALGLAAAAEGVEHPDQLAGLRAIGCDFAQGFLFARPVPADAITALITDQRRW